MRRRSNLQEDRDAGQGPLGRLVAGLEAERPDVRGTASSGPVHWALVHVLRLLFVLRDRLDEHHRHQGQQLLRPGVRDEAGRGVPSRTLHVQTVDVGAFARRRPNAVKLSLSCRSPSLTVCYRRVEKQSILHVAGIDEKFKRVSRFIESRSAALEFTLEKETRLCKASDTVHAVVPEVVSFVSRIFVVVIVVEF